MKGVFTLLTLCAVLTAGAQTDEGYKFTDIKTIPATSVKDQSRSGTCWCYATLAMVESDILRNGGGEIDLSEMWIVRNIYFEKAVKYVRLHGSLNLAVGGQSHDVLNGIRDYGIVPESVYPGLNYGYDKPNFNEIDAVIKAYCDGVIRSGSAKDGRLTTAWQQGLNGILDAYFGARPEKFTCNGKEYTPQTYAASLPVDMKDYVSITSFTHHPFYTRFVVEVPDNWAWEASWNLPLEELMLVVDNAIASGYTIAWAADVSEKGFDRTKAVGIVPEADLEGMGGTEAEKWGKLSDKEKDEALYKFDKPGKERVITQQLRQEAYDNYETTDDHGMQIVGTAVDQAGNPYFKVKNSWGVRDPYQGYFYFSRPFVEYKTISLIVNRKALSKELLKRGL